MSNNKKSLLTESEIRRFMKLANIPAIGKEVIKEESEAVQPRNENYGDKKEVGYGEMEEVGYGEMGEEDEMPPEGEEMGGGETDSGTVEQLFSLLQTVMKPEYAEQFNVEPDSGGDMDVEVDDEGGDDESMEEPMEEPMEKPMEEPMEEEGEEGEEKETKQLDESKLVDVVLSRVTARLVAEAKKKKMTAAEKKKKEDQAKKKKEEMKKKAADAKKKLEEANAPAPKSTMSNASAAGVAKAAGKADKGTFGVTSTMRKDDSYEEGTSKRGDKMTDVSASAEHTVSHGKKNLAIQGGNKKK